MQQYITTTGGIVSIVSAIIQYTQTTASILQFYSDETKSSHESRTRDDAPDCFSCLIKNSHRVNLINIWEIVVKEILVSQTNPTKVGNNICC